jgi:hypothetical protein
MPYCVSSVAVFRDRVTRMRSAIMPMAVNPLSGNQGAAFGCSATTLSLGAARQSVGPFDPIGHSGRTKFAAAATAHPWPERWHRGIVRPVIHLDRALVPAVLAGHEQAPDRDGACRRASSGGLVPHPSPCRQAKNTRGTESSDRDRFPAGNQCSLSSWRRGIVLESDPKRHLTAATGGLASPCPPTTPKHPGAASL